MSKAGTSNTVPTSTEPINLVLFGRVGNGKSSLGNSIIRKTELKNGKVVSVRAFEAKAAAGGVTSECKMATTTLPDGQIVNVIDTPGIFDTEGGAETLQKEIRKGMQMTTNGIHGFLLVFSIRTRFSEQEAYAIKYLTNLFGDEIVNYMIVVFTGADELEYTDTSLQDYFESIPQVQKDIVTMCDNRVVFFDNKTKEEYKRRDQVQQLMHSVKMVLAANSEMPFTNEFFEELKIMKRFEGTINQIRQDLVDERLARKKLEQKLFLRRNCSIQ